MPKSLKEYKKVNNRWLKKKTQRIFKYDTSRLSSWLIKETHKYLI